MADWMSQTDPFDELPNERRIRRRTLVGQMNGPTAQDAVAPIGSRGPSGGPLAPSAVPRGASSIAAYPTDTPDEPPVTPPSDMPPPVTTPPAPPGPTPGYELPAQDPNENPIGGVGGNGSLTSVPNGGGYQNITLPMIQQAFAETGLTSHQARGNMEPIAAWFRAHGFPDAHATPGADDGITVGGVFIDMLKSGSDEIWYGPETGGDSGAPNIGNSQLDQTLRDMLIRLMGGGERNPNIDRVTSAYRTSRQQLADWQRAAMAERMASEGLNSGGQGSGAFDTGVQGIYENAGRDISNEAAQVEYQDYQRQRQELFSAMQLAEALGARQEANQLRLYLAQLDNQYRYAALGQNQSQFEDTMAFDWEKWLADQNRLALTYGLNGG